MALDPHILAIDIINASGTVISSTIDGPLGRKVAHIDEFRQLVNFKYGDVYFKEPHSSPLLHKMDIDFIAPIFLDRNENFQAL